MEIKFVDKANEEPLTRITNDNIRAIVLYALKTPIFETI